MHICLDCRLGGSRHAGIGRYITQLVRHCLSEPTGHTWTLLVSDHAQAQEILADSTQTAVSIVVAQSHHYSLSEQWRMPRLLNSIGADVVHIPHFNVPVMWSHPRLVVTIHDLLWHEQRGTQVTTLPAWKYWIKYCGYRWVTRHAVNAAQAICVPSATVAQTVTAYFPNTRSKLVVTKEGATPLLKNPGQISPIPSKTIVYIGSLYPHKNIVTVLQALQLLPDFQLIICGARSVFAQQTQELAQKLGVAQRVTLKGYVPDEAIAKMLFDCTAVIQPSLSEGFGLPGVEAQASGIPLVASDIPVFREVYADAAAYFEPTNPESCAQSIRSTQDPATRKALSQAGMTWARQYSWKSMAQATLACYNSLK